MANATRSRKTIGDVSGVRFTTDSRQHTPEEVALQRIQSELSDGKQWLPENSTLPQLAFVSVMVVDGPTYSVITLWVPVDLESRAVELLRGEGFTVE